MAYDFIVQMLPYLKDWMDRVFVLMTTNTLLQIFFAIFIVNRISKLLQKIR